jgi:hypothetical protein
MTAITCDVGDFGDLFPVPLCFKVFPDPRSSALIRGKSFPFQISVISVDQR